MEHTNDRLNAGLAGMALLALLAWTMPSAAGAAPQGQDPCAQALSYERTASQDSIPRQAAYDSAVAGLAANVRCADQQMRLVNEAYLLSMRAAAAHDLRVGDWQRDITRANSLLTECTGFPGIKGTSVAEDCRTQIANNRRVAAIYAAQAAASAAPKPAGSPTPAPRTGPPATPAPLPTPPAPRR